MQNIPAWRGRAQPGTTYFSISWVQGEFPSGESLYLRFQERGKPTTKKQSTLLPQWACWNLFWGIFLGNLAATKWWFRVIQWLPLFASTLNNPSPLNSWDRNKKKKTIHFSFNVSPIGPAVSAAPSGSLPKGWRYHLAPGETIISQLPLHLDGNPGFVPLQSLIYMRYFPTFSTYDICINIYIYSNICIHFLMISYFCSSIDATWMSEKNTAALQNWDVGSINLKLHMKLVATGLIWTSTWGFSCAKLDINKYTCTHTTIIDIYIYVNKNIRQ